MSSNGAQAEERDDRANILIVDDLPEKLLVFRTILEDLGQNLIMVRSGSEALAEVLRREFAVVLLDVNMPDIDGFETASLIRQYKKSAHTPIIFITAYADEMQTARGYSLGAVDYILSPIQPEVLCSKVKVFVELYQLQQRTRQMADERVALAQSEAARHIAEEANRRKDDFIAMLSHELRNPLAPIRAATEVIRRIAPREATLSRASDVINRQVSHLVQLVDELLDVSRISQGRIVLKREQVDLERVVAHGVETVRPLIESRRQNLSMTMPGTPVWVSGDFVRLSQVVANLLNNAAKYTHERGRIEVTVGAKEGRAVVIVRDNGPGIDAELLPRMFDLFVQGDRSLDRSQGGLGIGLTLVRHLVELHDGRIEAFSRGAGEGSTFRVHLPCISAVVGQPRESAPPASEQPARGCRVLIVDDNRDAAESVAMFLRLEGHEVKVETDPLDALAAAPVFSPYAVLLDIGLPGLNGYEVALRLREQPGGDALVLIALTGYGQKEDRDRAISSGFDYHLVKPADPSEIQAAIARGPARATDAPAVRRSVRGPF